jgi:hypothetical protein
MAIFSGFMTGLMGYSLKKEMLSDALFFKELQTFKYSINSLDISGLSPYTIQQNIYNEFKTKYSGDINVKVFNQPTDYTFPNDSIRVSRFEVEVQVRSVPQQLGLWQPELGTNYYKGLDSGFLQDSGMPLLDFREDFGFETNDNGLQIFNHNLSFGLLTGNKQIAVKVASGIFSKDKDTTFGISTMVGSLATIADPTTYQNFYTESYDTIRNVYSFSRKREILPSGIAGYIFNLIHVLDLKDDGIIDVTERGTVRGKLTFLQAQQGADSLIFTSYARCNAFYGAYSSMANSFTGTISSPLITAPTRTLRMLNRPALTNDYEVGYTNNPEFKSDGSVIEEIIDLNDLEIGIMSVKHTSNFTINKRSSAISFATLIQNSVASSPGVVSGYFNAYAPGAWQLHHIKKEIAWPNKKNKNAHVVMEYSNHPKYFVKINGVSFRTLDYKVAHTKPVDMVTEYKVINRPSQTSIVNYAYQTERGQVTINIDAGISRNPDEFISSFRSDIGTVVSSLYSFSTTVFFNEFRGSIPISFTYYLSDIKYTYNSDNGLLQLTTVYTYSLKKYVA